MTIEDEQKKATELLKRCEEALLWCGGSGDFNEGGVAYVGWERMVRPVLEELRALRAKGER